MNWNKWLNYKEQDERPSSKLVHQLLKNFNKPYVNLLMFGKVLKISEIDKSIVSGWIINEPLKCSSVIEQLNHY